MVLLGLVLLPACGRRTPSPSPVISTRGSYEEGIASWYGPGFHGRTTANGETYDMFAMTAAHKTLPFDTWVRVINLENRESTIVRINDRGPFIQGRVIDLSRTAAENIDMVRPGTARVRILIVDEPAVLKPLQPGVETVRMREAKGFSAAPADPEPEERAFQVQVGAFRNQTSAMKMQVRLGDLFSDVTVSESVQPDGRLFRVRVGRFGSRESADEFRELLLKEALVQEAIVTWNQP